LELSVPLLGQVGSSNEPLEAVEPREYFTQLGVALDHAAVVRRNGQRCRLLLLASSVVCMVISSVSFSTGGRRLERTTPNDIFLGVCNGGDSFV
jgi:hypothetical protein